MEKKKRLYWVETNETGADTEVYSFPTWDYDYAEFKARQIWGAFDTEEQKHYEVYVCGVDVPATVDAVEAFESWRSRNEWWASYLLCLRYEEDDDYYPSYLYDDPTPEQQAGWAFEDKLYTWRHER